MKIIVTGGSGSVGKYIVNELLSYHHHVCILDRVEPKRTDVHFKKIELLQEENLVPYIEGYDAVIHCAGIPHPLNDPAEKVFRTNVMGTFNMLEASAHAEIKKFVFTSSESTLGFAFAQKAMSPEYIPIDEAHVLRPQDPYGLSKVVCEEMLRAYSLRYGMRTIALRMPWIWVPEKEMVSFYTSLIHEYEQWYKNLWTNVHVFDVAQAHRLAVEKDLDQFHEIFFITAKENWTGKDSKALLERFYPSVEHIDPGFSGAQTFISHAKAQKILGYEAKYTIQDLLN